MILYRIEYGTRVRWFGTEADMRKAKRLIKERGVAITAAEKTEVPVDKKGLLAWLNECCNERSGA